MVFPVDKETWDRRTGKNLAEDELGDVIPADDHNDVVDFLERLEDTLGITIVAGYGSVKLRLDDMPTLADSFVLHQLVQGKL